MDWKKVAPAIGAGLLGSAAFWWVALQYLCADCGAAACEWSGGCVAGWGIPLAVVLVVVSIAVPARLVEGRWPWTRRGGGG